jgi:hypothetical protein
VEVVGLGEAFARSGVARPEECEACDRANVCLFDPS